MASYNLWLVQIARITLPIASAGHLGVLPVLLKRWPEASPLCKTDHHRFPSLRCQACLVLMTLCARYFIWLHSILNRCIPVTIEQKNVDWRKQFGIRNSDLKTPFSLRRLNNIRFYWCHLDFILCEILVHPDVVQFWRTFLITTVKISTNFHYFLEVFIYICRLLGYLI